MWKGQVRYKEKQMVPCQPLKAENKITHLICFIHACGFYHTGSWPLLDVSKVLGDTLRPWHWRQWSPPLLGCIWWQGVWNIRFGNGIGPRKSWAMLTYEWGCRGTCSLVKNEKTKSMGNFKIKSTGNYKLLRRIL